MPATIQKTEESVSFAQYNNCNRCGYLTGNEEEMCTKCSTGVYTGQNLPI